MHSLHGSQRSGNVAWENSFQNLHDSHRFAVDSASMANNFNNIEPVLVTTQWTLYVVRKGSKPASKLVSTSLAYEK